MAILKRAGTVLVTATALAAGAGLAASPALAGTGSAAVAATWTVKPGGAITAKAGTTKLHDVNTNLHVYNVNGCAGLINSGDATTFSGSYTISPKQTITSP